MPELAKAYVQIIPSAEGIQGSLGKIMDGEADSAGKSAGGKFSSVFGSVAKAGLAAAGAGLAAASTAVVKVAKDAVAGYADYEQLVGGVETLFKDSASAVIEYAYQASHSAGLSANEYMETVTSFSASLLQSLDNDTQKAADIGNMAIKDMSDNANKMGTSMESIQNAYQGFAKQNYTMLDNLKLGYGGTKSEMERLLADATALSGVEYDIDSLADVYEAIHAIQTELGITGTTAKEASSTISGSLATAKATFQNLVAAMANPDADIGALFDEFVSDAEIAVSNLLPVVERALGGIADVIGYIAPVIAEKLPGLVEAVLPPLLSAATSLVTALIQALPTILQVLVDQGPAIIDQLITTTLKMLPEIIAMGLDIIVALAQGIAESIPELVPTIVDVVLEIVDVLTDPETLVALVDASLAIIIALANGIIDSLPRLIEKGPEIVVNLMTAVIEAAPKMLEAAFQLVDKLIKGIADNLPKIWQAGKDMLNRLWDGITELDNRLTEKGNELIEKFGQGIKDNLLRIWEWGKEIVTEIWNGITSLNPIQWGSDLISNFVGGIKSGWNTLKNGLSDIGQGIKDFIGFSEPKKGPLSNFHTFAPDMMKLFAQGIRDNEHLITDQIEDSFDFSPAALNTRDTDRLNMAIAGVGAYRFSGPEKAAPESAADGNVALLAEAIAAALHGCCVYMDGQTVGRLVTRAQATAARAYG